MSVRTAAYVYPGWHPIPERDTSFHPGFTEWELVASCRPRFEGHAQPRVPLLGPYDDRDAVEVGKRIALARGHGVDAMIYGFFWCRGKRVFEDALDLGFLGSSEKDMPFACMWSNRMPRRVLPVRRSDVPVISEERRVPSDVDDFVEMVATIARSYMSRPNYLRVDGRSYLSIYDSSYFMLELGCEAAAEAIRLARRWLAREGFPDLHLAAIEPNEEFIGRLAEVGFDSVTHYVLLPDWKGPYEQDYSERAAISRTRWPWFAKASGLPYFPSVSPGWDATPRGADFGPRRPDRYPWSPVVTGESPERFHDAMEHARKYAETSALDDPLLLVASWNEWSEGHYLEPDERFGLGWLEAVAAATGSPSRR